MSQWEDIGPEQKTKLTGALKNIPLLNCFSEEQIDKILEESTIRNFDPGEIILLKGEISESLYVVGSGNAVVCLKDKRVPLGGCSYFGELSLFLRKPVTCTVKGGDKGAHILALPGKILKEAVESNTEAKKILDGIISQRSVQSEKKKGIIKKPATLPPKKK